VSSVLPCYPTSEISPLALCSISQHFQILHYCLSNCFFWRTFISIFHVSLAPKPKGLRSSGFHLLSVPRIKPHAGTRVFSIPATTLRNSLSEHVRSQNSTVSFRHHLKTYLFRLAYPSYVSLLSYHC